MLLCADNLMGVVGSCLASVEIDTAMQTSGSLLIFGPIKVSFLAIWVYLCLYTVYCVDVSPLVPNRNKTVACIISLAIGPLLCFVLTVVDVVTRLQAGEIGLVDVPNYLLGRRIGGGRVSRGKIHPEDYIELLDASGRSFAEVYGGENAGRAEVEDRSEVLDLTRSIVLQSIKQRASDILIDPKSDGVYTVRLRVDGFLRNIEQIDADKCNAVVNSIKALSAMDISEKRRPQDGSFMAKIPQGSVFFRVASSGVLGGEKLSIRVLNRAEGMLTLDQVGLSEQSYRLIKNIILQPSGMVLLCGPTGSGKTTSLYAMLSAIDFNIRNVITVEDPIEYMLDYASQIEVNVKADITFANALRSILRQDPDVICVGEIRDAETAGMALQSSQTGHLVLATLHSSSNMATLVRLIDLGIKPLLLSSALSVIISQRLVRRLCDDCKKPAKLSSQQATMLQGMGIDLKFVMEAAGCQACYGTGFCGRTAIVDILKIDENIKAALAEKELSMGQLKKQGDKAGRSRLRKEGLKKVGLGLTTLDEVKRVTSDLG